VNALTVLKGYQVMWHDKYMTRMHPMSSVISSPVSFGDVKSGTSVSELSLLRLYALRVFYLVIAAGLGTFVWPAVIHHTNEFAAADGVRFALLAGLGAMAALGLRYPVQMLPVLLFELAWKAIYLVAFALPLWSAHQIDAATAEDIKAVLMVVVLVPLVPWRYVFAQYVMKHGDRWK
jgi:hypothetical protein